MASGIGFMDILVSEVTMIVAALVFLFCGVNLLFRRKHMSVAWRKTAGVAMGITGLYLMFILWLVIMWG